MLSLRTCAQDTIRVSQRVGRAGKCAVCGNEDLALSRMFKKLEHERCDLERRGTSRLNE